MTSITRRHFLGWGTASVGTLFLPALLPTLSGCDSPDTATVLSARNDANGKHWCVSYGMDGHENFRTEVPQRCHDVLQHPSQPLTLFIARRPGTHCYLLDTRNGDLLQVLSARQNRHFYGHGVFDSDGTLYLTENDTTEPGRGVLGIYTWNEQNRLVFSSETSTHGIEPHQFVWLAGNTGFAIANGGIRTEAGSRSALDEHMESSLVLMDKQGTLISKETLPAGNSIRHIAIARDGTIVTAQQFSRPADDKNNTDNSAAVLLAIKRPSQPLAIFPVSADTEEQLQGYSASVAIHSERRWLAVTAPRGNRLLLWDMDTEKPLLNAAVPDCAGITSTPTGFIVSSGEGNCRSVQQDADAIVVSPLPLPAGGWDNHLILV